MKRNLRRLAVYVVLAVLLCTPLQAAAIDLDGNVMNLEWYDYATTDFFRSGGDSQCAITHAAVRHVLQRSQNRVVFGISAAAAGASAQTPVGAVFTAGGREIARWQQGREATCDAAHYSLQGMGYFPNSIDSSYTYEIALGYKTESALAALRGLSMQLLDPQGEPSRQVSYPIIEAEAPTVPVTTTTTTAATTAKTTTTKVTTTKATTTKITTTKATTIKTTTSKTTKTTKAAANTAAVPVQTQAAVEQQTQAQPSTAAAGKSETIWYTRAQASAAGQAEAVPSSTVPEFAMPAEQTQTQTLPTLAVPEAQAQAQLSSPSGWMYFGAAGLLAAAAAALVYIWLRTQKKAKGTAPPDV